MDHDTNRIRDVKTNKEYGSPVNLSRLRPYHNEELFNTKFENTTSTIRKDSKTDRTTRPAHTPPTKQHEWFTVDRLLKSKLINGQKHYFIKWKGKFPNSWEPEDHISDYCKRQFHIRRTQQGTLRNNLSVLEQTSKEV